MLLAEIGGIGFVGLVGLVGLVGNVVFGDYVEAGKEVYRLYSHASTAVDPPALSTVTLKIHLS
jgi:hypothetical protein